MVTIDPHTPSSSAPACCEGCHGLKKQHLNTISKAPLLKYLSLRNTDVTELPKQIKELQCLETLGVWQTKVQVLSEKPTVLPLLKHFLAGHKVPGIHDTRASEDSISAVQMPLLVDKMKNMEVLSHVQFSNSHELAGISELLKLKKLGVALQEENAKLSDLFLQIEKLNECLHSLSIWVYHKLNKSTPLQGGDPLPSIPQFIERLNISGITGGIRHLIEEHHNLTKITVCEVQLMEGDLSILGKLRALHCLRLQHNSYTTGCKMLLKGAEFQSLNYLLVEGKDTTKITFDSGAAPKLERIVWSFPRMDDLSGLNHLTKLNNLDLKGNYNRHRSEEYLFWHPNGPTLNQKPIQQRQEHRASTSSSSAP